MTKFFVPGLVFAMFVGLGAGSGTALAAPKLPQAKPTRVSTKAPSTKPAPKSSGIKWIKGRLVGIDTDKTGQIQTVTIDVGGGMLTANGCGAKIANLPHVAGHTGGRVNLRVNNGCIDRYVTSSHGG